MRNSCLVIDSTSPRRVGAVVILGALCISVALGAEQEKKSAPAAHPAPAAHAAPAAGGAAHGSSSAAGGGGSTASHAPTTSSASASHGVTTSSASHGVTTTSASHGVTTTSAAGHTTSTEGNRSAASGGVHPGASAGAAGGRAGSSAAGGQHAGAFANHPPAAGSHDAVAKNGAAVRTRADGTRSDVHDPKTGMDIHHGLSGNRRTTVERPDGSRVVAERGGRGYVQHPYSFHGHEFGHRTFYDHGRAYDRFYGRYPYGGRYLDVYAPGRFYPYGFYGYAYSPWAAPVPYAWGWGGAPWYGYYGAYYAPYPVYPAPAFWLADFVIAASLEAAFIAQATADLGPVPAEPGLSPPVSPPAMLAAVRWVADRLVEPAEADAAPAMSPEVKQLVADEIKALVQQEGDEAKANAANQDVDPSKGSVAQLLADNQAHVFVAGSDIDIVTVGSSQECAVSQGDVLKVASAPPANAETANATVLASKLGTKGYSKECAAAATVAVAISDLQDMRNHMREQVDDGLTELQSKQGKNGLPAAPAGAVGAPTKAAFAAGAPPPDASAAEEIRKQSSEADAAENDAVAAVAAGSAGDGGAGGSGGASGSATISVGQSIDAVTGVLGAPTKIIDMGAVKKYVYPDMKITFKNGKVSDVE